MKLVFNFLSSIKNWIIEFNTKLGPAQGVIDNDILDTCSKLTDDPQPRPNTPSMLVTMSVSRLNKGFKNVK
ncbi:hypothetical protein TI04_08645 [Achromatium sp. WMS2]|nr:hypothetical protein TI04_08645 [Achromatium sp. WMS2]